MKNLLVTIMISIFMIIGGCAENLVEKQKSSNCQKEIDACVKNRGNPEEINKYDSGDYHSWTFWYWCKGFSMTFTWGEYVDGCETSTYTFSPICSSHRIDRNDSIMLGQRYEKAKEKGKL